MLIKRDSKIEDWLFDEIRDEWGKEREGIHLSDLLTPRQAYWRNKKPQKATNDEIMYWASGKGHEGALFSSAGYQHGEAKQWNGIWYTPDLFETMPIELKTRRRGLAEEGKEAEEYEHYLKQLKGYCAVENKKQGWLWVWCLVQKQDNFTTKPELACYRVEWTDLELDMERGRLSQTHTALIKAINDNDWTHLQVCPQWMCGKVKTEVIQKPHCITCKKDFETQKGIEKHILTKSGKGHKTKDGIFKPYYEPRCKWIDDCKPFDKEV